MPVIYILHFDNPLAHAQHYAGSTINLRTRLTNHAIGAGSQLTKHLCQQGLNWKLGGLFETSRLNLRKIERYLKDQHNAARYCELCQKTTSKLQGTRPYSIANVPFPTDSKTLLAQHKTTPETGQTVQVYRTSDIENINVNKTMMQIVELMSSDKDALGFIPAGGEQGLNTLVQNGKIILASDKGRLVGYIALTNNDEYVNIHQCCVRDEYRLFGLGKRMVTLVTDTWKTHNLKAKVRNDLAANEFWTAIGFKQVAQLPHPTSHNLINHYVKEQA